MDSGLENLVKNVPKFKLKYLSQEFSKNQLELVKQKGHYPFEYMNSFERFEETKLPKKEGFYSLLNDKHIISKDYGHALKIWNEYVMKNIGNIMICI